MRGVAWPTAAAGTVVDVTAELIGQFLFSVFGLLTLVLLRSGSPLLLPAGVTLAVAGLLAAAAAVRFRRVVGRGLGGRLLGKWFRGQGGLDRVRTEVNRLYSDPRRLLLASMVHLLGWFSTGVGTWISLRLLGFEAAMLPILALEALLDALVTATFVVPGAVGVQEAGYVGLGAVFGVPPDLALGLPILLLFQWIELHCIKIIS